MAAVESPLKFITGPRERWLKAFPITPESLVELFKNEEPGLSFAGMPRDGKAVCAYIQQETGAIVVIIESEEFPVISPGNWIENGEIVVKRWDGKAHL